MPNETASGTEESRPVPSLHVCFGLYEVNLQKGELRKRGLKLKVPHQSLQILAMLLERPGQVVSREDLRRALWPGDVFVNFEGSLNSAVQRLRSALQDTSRGTRYIETLPRVGYRFTASIEPVVPVSGEAPDRTATPASAGLPAKSVAVELPTPVAPPDRKWSAKGAVFRAAIQERNSAASSGAGRPVLREFRRRPWAAATLLFLIALSSNGWYRYGRAYRQGSASRSQAPAVIPQVRTRRSIAIIGFANVSGDARNLWLSTAFAEMLATEMAAGDQLRTLAGEHVARAKLELSLRSEDSYTTDTLIKIHKDLGCDYVVTGSYVAIGQAENERLRLDARVQDVLTGDTVANVAVAGTRKDLFDLASRAGEQLLAKLGVGPLTETESAEVKLSLPADPQAARLYSEGLAKLRVYDDVEAGHIFERVIRLEPEYSPAYSALASVWSALGYDTRAIAAARKAMDLAHNLPAQARMQTEARYHEMNGTWSQAAEIYLRLWQSYSDNLDYGLHLAEAQDAMGKTAEATATLAVLRKLPSPAHDDPRIDLAEARIAGELADYKREQTLADAAARKAAATGAALLLARAKLAGGTASDALGNLRSATDAFAVARRIFAQSGDADRSALASMNMGSVLAKRGDLSGARHNIEQALNVFRQHGDQAHQAAALSNLGEMWEIEGDLPKAENLVRQAVAIFAKLNRVSQRDMATYNVAELLQHQGRFREAKDALAPLVEPLRSAGNKWLLGYVLETLSSISEVEGDMPAALDRYREAAALFKETDDKPGYADAKRSLGKAFLRTADFVSAKQSLSEALSVDRSIGAEANADLDRIELAELSLAQGLPADMAALRAAAGDLRARKIQDNGIAAQIALARALIRQAKNSEAATALREAANLAAGSYDPTVRFDVALATAHLRSAQRCFEEARRAVQSAQQKAVAIGCVRCQLEARLELGEIEIRAGNTERGRAHLQQLADDAGSKGYGLVARIAAADSIGPTSVPRTRPGEAAKHNPNP